MDCLDWATHMHIHTHKHTHSKQYRFLISSLNCEEDSGVHFFFFSISAGEPHILLFAEKLI